MKHERRDIRKTIAVVTLIVFFMFSFTFVLAPLYNSLCRATGINGKADITTAVSRYDSVAPVLSRDVTMQFVTTTNADLPWEFYPEKTSLELHPEQNTKMLFYVKNKTNRTITVQAIPSITPWQAAKHLHKVECFCFTHQTLKAGEGMSMPVVFRLDKNLPPEIKTVTLAYTLFEVPSRKDGASKTIQ